NRARLRPARLRLTQRQADGKFRARPFSGAVGAHRPAVKLDEVAHDREAEPEATLAASRRAVRLPEALEDVRQEFRSDADARVAHDDIRVSVRSLQLADRPAAS